MTIKEMGGAEGNIRGLGGGPDVKVLPRRPEDLSSEPQTSIKKFGIEGLERRLRS